MVLADHVVVEDLSDLLGRRDALARLRSRGLIFLPDDVNAEFHALVADEHCRAGDELANLVLALAAERAIERILRITGSGLSVNRGLAATLECGSDAGRFFSQGA